ncbi:hypothetical protein LUZ61_004097 [Rhynchospora tenuis]|uniref:Uncharacterized protein n=1 Tax=Rhynchospora tenuis TaxID=198213 RepID=A0AAD6ET98_9POAL|nr:hypothetical protein LUZ61_004097 [Rhynchospora tenuis]
MQSRERMRPGPVAPGYSVGGGPASPYSRSHAQGHTGYSRGNSKSLYSPSRKYEILEEAGRLATEYLVSTGVLPPNSSQRNWTSGNPQDFKGPNGTYQDYKGSMNQNLAYNDPRGPQDRRRRFNDDYDRWRPRKDGRGKKKSGYYKKGYSDWDRNRGRNSSRDYSDDEDGEEDEYSGPSYHRERRGTNFDEVGSSVSGVAGESGSVLVKRETQRESGSDLEDTGSKASSCSIRKDTQPEAGEVSNAEPGEVSNGEKVDASIEVGSDVKDIDMPDRDMHVRDDENGYNDNKNLLKYCDHVKAPTKPRSVLPQNRAPLVDSHINEGIAENISNNLVEGLSSPTVENRENQDVEMFVPAPAQTPVEREKEFMNSYAQPIILEEEQEVKEESKVRRDEGMVEADTTDEGKTGTSIASDAEPEPEVMMQEVQEREKGIDGASFKTCDLNLSNNQEVTEIPDDPMSTSSEPNKEKMVNLGSYCTVGQVSVGESSYKEENDVVQVIHIEDDSPVTEMIGSDQAKPKESGELSYSNTENMLTNIGNVDVMPVVQEGFNFNLSDYLGSDITSYQMQNDLRAAVRLKITFFFSFLLFVLDLQMRYILCNYYPAYFLHLFR